MNEKGIEYLHITSIISSKKYVHEKLARGYTKISMIESYITVNQKFTDSDIFIIWHDRLGHPGSITIRRITENSYGHPLKNQNILLSKDFSCAACFQGKLIIRPSPMKVVVESLAFLERIQGD